MSVPPTGATANSTSAPIRFGQYRVVGHLGTGLLTHVYLAEAEGLARQVVVKVLRSSVGAASPMYRQFEREARLLSSLRHPNIRQLFHYDPGEAGARPPYIVLEHVEGAHLGELLTRLGRLEPEEAAVIATETARGLSYAHRNGIVHRDVKPANILIGATQKAGGGAASTVGLKLADFGTATSGPADSPALNEADAVGTPAYMSPEQLLGERVDSRSDQFSLGLVLFQMLAGVRPFDGDDERPAIQRVRREPPPTFRSLGVVVPRVLERIVNRLLAKRPADRFPETDELVAELGRFLEDRRIDRPEATLRRILARAGIREERRANRPTSDREGREVRQAPIVARAVPLTPTLLGLALISTTMMLGAAGIQTRAGGLRSWSHASPAPSTSSSDLGPNDLAEVKILVRPWAEVSVDGHLVDVTPLPRPITMPPGRHVIVLAHPSASERRELELKRAQRLTLEVTLPVATPHPSDEFLMTDPSVRAPTSASTTLGPAVPTTIAP